MDEELGSRIGWMRLLSMRIGGVLKSGLLGLEMILWMGRFDCLIEVDDGE